jgi:chromosomal replication initiator protein
MEFAQAPSQALGNIIPAQGNAITIEAIQRRVSANFHLRELGDEDLTADSNRQIFVFPRQLAMYLARQLTTASLPEIGRQFGMHHTTVLHSIKKIERRRRSDQGLNRTITRLMEALRQSQPFSDNSGIS